MPETVRNTRRFAPYGTVWRREIVARIDIAPRARIVDGNADDLGLFQSSLVDALAQIVPATTTGNRADQPLVIADGEPRSFHPGRTSRGLGEGFRRC